MKNNRLQFLLFLSLAAGTFLRFFHLEDMEYKDDERYMYESVMGLAGKTPYPDLGMGSGVFIRNPGLSIWVFSFLAQVFKVSDPVSLAQIVGGLGMLSICMLAIYGRKQADPELRDAYTWVAMLSAVNPFLVAYERKIWTQSILPIFSISIFILMREILTSLDKNKKASTWMVVLVSFLLGTIGQIHMSGFFFGACMGCYLVYQTLFQSTPILETSVKSRSKKTLFFQIVPYFTGVLLSIIPMIPWLQYFSSRSSPNPPVYSWAEVIQLKFFVFWPTQIFGLHLGNILGVHQGGHWAQLSDFFRYPVLDHLVADRRIDTYLVLAAHLGLLLIMVFWLTYILIPLVFKKLGSLVHRYSQIEKSGQSNKAIYENRLVNVALFSYGPLLTITGIRVKRYYLNIVTPLEFFSFVLTLDKIDKRLRSSILLLTWFLSFLISFEFIDYVHKNGGSVMGDYGQSYSSQKQN